MQVNFFNFKITSTKLCSQNFWPGTRVQFSVTYRKRVHRHPRNFPDNSEEKTFALLSFAERCPQTPLVRKGVKHFHNFGRLFSGFCVDLFPFSGSPINHEGRVFSKWRQNCDIFHYLHKQSKSRRKRRCFVSGFNFVKTSSKVSFCCVVTDHSPRAGHTIHMLFRHA